MSWSGIPYAIEAILGERKKRDEIRDKAMKKLRASTTGDRTMSDETLKPCPFCGCAFPAVGYDGDAKTLGRKECITARCRQCGGETRKFSSQAEAITAWNTRAEGKTTEALQADNARLREAIVVLRLGLLGVIDSDDAGAIAWAKHHGEAIDWDQYPEATRAALQEAGQ